MTVKDTKRFEDTTVLLQRGIDYEDDDIEPDLFSCGRLSHLKARTLTRIAQENGYDSWSWSDFETNGSVKAIFRRDLDPGREGEIAKAALKLAAQKLEQADICVKGNPGHCLRMYPSDPEYCVSCIQRHLIGQAVKIVKAATKD